MKKLLVLGLAVMLTGCPKDTTQLQQAAQAADNASIIIQGFQTGEIAAYEQGQSCLKAAVTDADKAACVVISTDDHVFIQKELKAVTALGKTTDACILNAGTNAGVVACVNSAITTIDGINNDGGLYLKSPQAKQSFQLAMVGARTTLATTTALLGGK